MPTFAASDGTKLAYHVYGSGSPVVCLPGGPMQASEYLGELGGLSAYRELVMLDLRGTGESAVPEDSTTYRCDRQVDDVEALREALGLEQLDLVAHSAGANLAVLYAIRYPSRVGKLALITPSVYAAGLTITGETRLSQARLRAGEPWFASAYGALEAITAGDHSAANWDALAPFSYGRWDDAAKAHQAADGPQRNDEAAALYGSGGAYTPHSTRAALATFPAPVLLTAGEYDLGAPPTTIAEYAALWGNATFTQHPSAGHFPWLDDAAAFTAVLKGFLG
ncbi:alpha/beta hydrolase [Streptomyces sp. SID13031]|uniref:alpha/beta fold hydrolase n=1 Tax=Streptomyces sp. SID13031 TaxID=2706046 RepID=UPI0013C6DD25|nr:alpha/beta hydrolase [Streptomyces sp. SID13031]NEA35341.1 alpha/beta hydrolase [Streptomyces sp. SID13031]